MIGYPFIDKLFKSILDKSVIIEGRFAIGTQWGGDLDNINIDDVVNALPAKQKYPCAILYPALTSGQIQDSNYARPLQRELYMLFVTGAKVTGQNAISRPAENLQSQHTIPETWHDMERCAMGFIRTLEHLIGETPEYFRQFSISQVDPPQLKTVTKLGSDAVSGVMLRFVLQSTTDCGFEDYADTINTIVLPDITDPHPLHKDM